MSDCTIVLYAFKANVEGHVVHAWRHPSGEARFWLAQGDQIKEIEPTETISFCETWMKVPTAQLHPVARAKIRAVMQPDAACPCELCR